MTVNDNSAQAGRNMAGLRMAVDLLELGLKDDLVLFGLTFALCILGHLTRHNENAIQVLSAQLSHSQSCVKAETVGLRKPAGLARGGRSVN